MAKLGAQWFFVSDPSFERVMGVTIYGGSKKFSNILSLLITEDQNVDIVEKRPISCGELRQKIPYLLREFGKRP